MPQVPTPRSILVPLMLAAGLCACVTPTATVQNASCSSLLPAEWRDGVSPAPMPQGETVGDWIVFADQQTGRLDQANGRTRDAIGIVTRCEERDQSAVRRSTRRRLFGIPL